MLSPLITVLEFSKFMGGSRLRTTKAVRRLGSFHCPSVEAFYGLLSKTEGIENRLVDENQGPASKLFLS